MVCTGGHHISRLKRQDVCDFRKDFGNQAPHGVGGEVVSQVFVHPEADAEVIWVFDFIRRYPALGPSAQKYANFSLGRNCRAVRGLSRL